MNTEAIKHLGLTKTQVISLQVLLLKEAGATVKEAFDAVLGAGAYNRLASDVYDELRGCK